MSDELHDAASTLGKKGGKAKSAKKIEAVSASLDQNRDKRWPTVQGCQCGAEKRTGRWKGKHYATCPVFKREAMAAWRKKKANETA